MAKHRHKLALASIVHCSIFILHSYAAAAAYVQHVPGDVEDSRRQFPLRVARGETVDLSIDFLDGGEPLDISGAEVTLHTRTNGMSQAESWQTPGTATNHSALFVLDVDAVLPAPSGEWSCVATRGGRTLARLGGPAYVRGTAAASAAALPQDALAGYATTGYVARAVAGIDIPSTNGFIKVELDPTVPAWAKSPTPPITAETDPVFAANSNRFLTAHQSLAPATNYADRVAARKQDRLPYATNAIPYSAIADRPDIPSTNGFIRAESDPVWLSQRAGYATTGAVAQVAAGLAGKADDFAVVHNYGDETIAGSKTFDDEVSLNNYLNVHGYSHFYSDAAFYYLAYFYGSTYFMIGSSGFEYILPYLFERPGFEVYDGTHSYQILFPAAAGTLALAADIPSTNGFIRAESDPTVPAWAKAAQPPEPGRTDVTSLNTVKYASGVLDLSIAAGATLTATTNSPAWPDGGAVFARIRPAGAYSVAPGIQLLGYGAWPTNSAEAVFVRSGGDILCSVLREGR